VRAQLADRLVLDRNPTYRGPRPRRPARIVYLTGVPSAKAVALADGGQADWILLASALLWTRGRGLSRLETDVQPLGGAA
jgi:hypothetical protein